MTSNLFNGALLALHDQSLPTIELLQTSFPENTHFMIGVSIFFDPRYVFLVYAPLVFALNKQVGQRLVAALTLTEWANQILKWLLAGERPYWYAEERALQLANSSLYLAEPHLRPIQLRQFPVTCELGAGSPSGHAMVTATVWYVLLDAHLRGQLPLLSRADAGRAGGRQLAGKLATQLTWFAYTLALLLVSLSRVYLACHFPHQCVCGALLGVAVARLVVERLPLERLGPAHFGLATGLMFSSALGTYALLRMLGLDPLWSVHKGTRWCADPAHLHLDTTPFASMVRYLGVCLGAGLACRKPRAAPASAGGGQRGHLLPGRRLLTALLSVGLGQLLVSVPVPRANLNLFYLISFLLYVLFAYGMAGAIPRLTKRLLVGEQDSRSAKVKLT